MEKIIDDEITIREYSNDYENKVVEFLIEVAINEFGFIEWQDYFYKKDFLNVDRESENFWIAVNNQNNVIGTIGVVKDENPHTAKINSLYVAKEYRRRGIASNLYEICLDFIKKNDYNIIILHTYEKFKNAIKFYEKQGFQVSKYIQSKDGIWYCKYINNGHSWNNYFGNIRAKYNMRVSKKKPLVIDLDGKNVTTSAFFSLLDNTKDGFLDIMEKTVTHFTYEYNCLAIFGVDEVSFIFDNAEAIIDKINKNRNFKADEIISIFSQYFFEYFNKLNEKQSIYWHGEIFSIPEQKVKSYIRYKSDSILNVFTTYFLKKNMIKDAGHIKLNEKIKLCNENNYYKDIEEYERGILYFKGERIDLDEYLNGDIKIIEETKKKIDTYVDPTSFNELFK